MPCFNSRAHKHRLAIRNKSKGHVVVAMLQCELLSELTKFNKRTRNKTEREIVEAFFCLFSEHRVTTASACHLLFLVTEGFLF